MKLRHGALRTILCVMLLTLASCSGGTVGGSDASVCVPGRSVSCTCDGGGSGAAMCGPDGVLAACVCAAGMDATSDASGLDVASEGDGGGGTDVPTDVTTDRVDAREVAADVPTDSAADVHADAVMEACAGTLCGAVCVDTSTDVHHCGGCAADCTALTNVVASAVQCVAGVCSIAGACANGTADCNRLASDGCETHLNTAANCGACGVACAEPTPMCSMMAGLDGGAGFACSSGCTGGTPTRCAMMCVDTTSDPANCGACGLTCTAGPNETAVCTGSICAVICSAGYANCDGAAANGCEVSTTNDPNHCGACGVVCVPPVGGSAQCAGGACVNVCPGGDHLCGSICVRNSDPANCGTSCTACSTSAPNVAAATCDGTNCGIACVAGWADCDGNLANGCESDLSSAATCGACTTACTGATGLCSVSGGVAACVPIPAPRQIAPLSTATVTSRQPILRWALSAGMDGARVELCGDRACTVSITTIDATGTSAAPTADLPTGVVYWRLHGRVGSDVGTAVSPTWQFTVGARTAPVNTSWGTTLDVNGDGYADVLVGDTQVNTGTGVAYLYLGSPAGLASAPTETLAGPDGAYGFFGASVASAGDVNGDGYSDVVVGAIGPGNHTGAAYVYLGGATGLANAYATVLGGPDGPSGNFGHSVAGAGDVNGDGYADVIVGADGVFSNTGATYVYLGGPSGLSPRLAERLTGPDGPNGNFGLPVATAGDIDADGYADVVVGAAHVASNTGRAYVYRGSAVGLGTTPATSLTGSDGGGSYFGFSVANAGDVNGDGYADLAVGEFESVAPSIGHVYIYLGGATGLPNAPSTTLTGPDGADGYFGNSVASAGDVEGDGYSDLVVGAYYANGTGRAYEFPGGSAGLASTPNVTITSPAGYGQYFGNVVANAGDVNGDGLGDALIQSTPVFLNTAGSAVYFYTGSATGLAPTPARSFTASDVTFGAAIASAVDVMTEPATPRAPPAYACLVTAPDRMTASLGGRGAAQCSAREHDGRAGLRQARLLTGCYSPRQIAE